MYFIFEQSSNCSWLVWCSSSLCDTFQAMKILSDVTWQVLRELVELFCILDTFGFCPTNLNNEREGGGDCATRRRPLGGAVQNRLLVGEGSFRWEFLNVLLDVASITPPVNHIWSVMFMIRGVFKCCRFKIIKEDLTNCCGLWNMKENESRCLDNGLVGIWSGRTCVWEWEGTINMLERACRCIVFSFISLQFSFWAACDNRCK